MVFWRKRGCRFIRWIGGTGVRSDAIHKHGTNRCKTKECWINVCEFALNSQSYVCLFHPRLFQIFSNFWVIRSFYFHIFQKSNGKQHQDMCLWACCQILFLILSKFDTLFNFHSLWNHQNQCGFLIISRGNSVDIHTDTHMMEYVDTCIYTENIIAIRQNVFCFNCEYMTQTKS